MKRISASQIALSALACALATIFLTVGVYSGFFLLTAYLLGSVVLMLPLCKRSFWGYALAYVSTCLLSLLFASFQFWDILPFILFFGLHPLVNELQLKTKINPFAACIAKAVWFDLTVFLVWKVVFAITTEVPFINTYILPIILVIGTLLFVGYDYLMFKWRIVLNAIVKRIGKK